MSDPAVKHARTLVQLYKAGTIVSEESWANTISTLVGMVTSGVVLRHSFDGEFYTAEASYMGRTFTGRSRKGPASAVAYAFDAITKWEES